MSGGHSLGQLGIRSYRESQLVRKTILLYIVSGTVSGMSLIDGRIHERIVAKKARLDNLRPFPEDAVRKLRQAIEIEFTYNSNAIEGNTLTLRETQLVIREGLTIGGKSLREHLEARNHPKAIQYIENLATQDLTENDILKIHKIICSGTLENAGEYRKSQVYIEGSDYIPPPAFEIPDLMKELLEWLRKNPEELRPVEMAVVFHYKLVSTHPFDDGNGRVARLLMNLLLIKHGYPMTVIRNYDRRRYYDTLRKADNNDLKPFTTFIARCVEQSLDLYLSAIEPTDKTNRLIPLSEAAKKTPYNQEYLSLLARKGAIAATKIGKNWHITSEALNEYLTRIKPKQKKTRHQTN
jgi:Fic family protein